MLPRQNLSFTSESGEVGEVGDVREAGNVREAGEVGEVLAAHSLTSLLHDTVRI
jgi:hypothetical protein